MGSAWCPIKNPDNLDDEYAVDDLFPLGGFSDDGDDLYAYGLTEEELEKCSNLNSQWSCVLSDQGNVILKSECEFKQSVG